MTAVPNASRVIVLISCLLAIGALIHGLRQPLTYATLSMGTPGVAVAANNTPAGDAGAGGATLVPYGEGQPPSAGDDAQPDQVVVTDDVIHIGIVAGHSGGDVMDVGAVCPDGLTELDVNLDVAQQVVDGLQAMGYQVDLLEEFDERLYGYQADALLSIHADSCMQIVNATPPASGFKVASVEDSAVPVLEEQLVSCLAQCYAARTGMYFHVNSITPDMSQYHTFYEIDSDTPAAIIETGFMYADRYILTERSDLVAQGIIDGIVCFLEEQY